MEKIRLTLVLLAAFAGFVRAASDDDGMAAVQAALLGAEKSGAQQVELRDTKITADRMEYNYKEAVAIATDNVRVDDARFSLTSDRLFVFLDGTNNLSQLVVMGRVSVSNENRRAVCDKATYTKADGRLVLVGHAKLTNIGKDGKESSVSGDKITIWTEDQRMEVYPRPVLTIPAGASEGLKGMMQ